MLTLWSLAHGIAIAAIVNSAATTMQQEKELTQAEAHLLAAVRSYSTATFRPEEDNVIRGEVLEALCRGQYVLPDAASVINVDGANILGPFNLSFLESSKTLAFDSCIFTDTVTMNAASARYISFDGSTLPRGLQAHGVRTTFALDLADGLHCDGSIEIPDARIGGQLRLSGAVLDGHGKHALLADGAVITGGAFFRATRAVGPISLLGVQVGGPIVFRDAQLSSLSGPCLYGDALHTNNNLQLNGTFAASGAVQIYEARIAGQLNCSGGTFRKGDGSAALHLSGSRIDGMCYLNDGFRAMGGVALQSCSIGRSLIVDGEIVQESDDFDRGETASVALSLRGIDVKEDIILSGLAIDTQTDFAIDLSMADIHGLTLLGNGFRANATVSLDLSAMGRLLCANGSIAPLKGPALGGAGCRLRGGAKFDGFMCKGAATFFGAEIGGELDCSGGTFEVDRNMECLVLRRANILGNVVLKEPVTALGQVTLEGATIEGSLVCKGAKFDGDYPALECDGSSIETGAFLEDCVIEGGASFVGARVGKVLSLTGATLNSPGGLALDGTGLIVEGSVMLGDGFVARGEVKLIAARVAQDLDISGGHIENLEGAALCLGETAVGANLVLRGLAYDGGLDLTGADVETLVDDVKSWPKTGLLMEGFKYRGFGGRSPSSVPDRLEWLRRMPSFVPGPYEQLAHSYQELGLDGNARAVRIAKMERASASEEKRLFPKRLWDCVLAETVGYGYEPWRIGIWAGIIVGVGALVFGWARRAGLLIPLEEGVGRPPFVALMYSLDVFLPIVSLGLEAVWRPANTGKRWLIWGYYWVHLLSGWVMTSLLLAVLSGVAGGGR